MCGVCVCVRVCGGGGGSNLGVIVVRVCAFFVPIYCWHLDKYSSQFIEYQENKKPRKISEQKYVHIPECQKSGAFYIGTQKNRDIHILFVEKRGPIIYLAALKKGVIRHAHTYMYYAIYRKLPPPPPPRGILY